MTSMNRPIGNIILKFILVCDTHSRWTLVTKALDLYDLKGL